MSAEAASLGAALTERFLLDFPREASREIEALPIDDAASMLATQPPRRAGGYRINFTRLQFAIRLRQQLCPRQRQSMRDQDAGVCCRLLDSALPESLGELLACFGNGSARFQAGNAHVTRLRRPAVRLDAR